MKSKPKLPTSGTVTVKVTNWREADSRCRAARHGRPPESRQWTWVKVPGGKNCHVDRRGKYADGKSADVSNVDIARTRQSTWSTEAPEASGARNLGIWGGEPGRSPFFQPAVILRRNSLLLASSMDSGHQKKPDACVRVVRLAELVKERPIFEGASRPARKRLNMPILLLRCEQPISRDSTALGPCPPARRSAQLSRR